MTRFHTQLACAKRVSARKRERETREREVDVRAKLGARRPYYDSPRYAVKWRTTATHGLRRDGEWADVFDYACVAAHGTVVCSVGLAVIT